MVLYRYTNYTLREQIFIKSFDNKVKKFSFTYWYYMELYCELINYCHKVFYRVFT